MNLESIQTPADLVRVNDEVSAYVKEVETVDYESILASIMELDYESMDNLVYALLQHQVNFHKLILETPEDHPSASDIDREKVIANLSKLRVIRDLYGEI